MIKCLYHKYLRFAVALLLLQYRMWDWFYKLTGKPRLKYCHECGCTVLSPLRSINKKKCTSCGHEMDWFLDPGQAPLVPNNRMVKRKKE